MSAAVASPAAELSGRLGLRCFGCGAADIVAVAPGLEEQVVAGFTYQRGQDVRGWCAQCRFKASPTTDTTPREDITMARRKTEACSPPLSRSLPARKGCVSAPSMANRLN